MSRELAFTVKYDGVTPVLMTHCEVCEAFDPTKTSDHRELTKITGLWDTGASCSAISKRAVDVLKLKTSGVAVVNHANGSSTVPTYLLNVMLPNNVGIPFVKVTEAQLNGDFDILIGMDIISKGDFSICNKAGKTTFSFQIPSTHDVDFVQEFNDKYHKPIVKDKLPERNDPCHCGSGKKYKNCHGK